jgi:nitronate monooxygenase
LSDDAVYQARPRVCDLGYLREAYRTAEGTVGFRCAGEPANVYVAKGGAVEDTLGRKCICNALISNIGTPQVRAGKHVEQGIITSGDDLAGLTRFLQPGALEYSAADVVRTLLAEPAVPHVQRASTSA